MPKIVNLIPHIVGGLLALITVIFIIVSLVLAMSSHKSGRIDTTVNGTHQIILQRSSSTASVKINGLSACWCRDRFFVLKSPNELVILDHDMVQTSSVKLDRNFSDIAVAGNVIFGLTPDGVVYTIDETGQSIFKVSNVSSIETDPLATEILIDERRCYTSATNYEKPPDGIHCAVDFDGKRISSQLRVRFFISEGLVDERIVLSYPAATAGVS